MFPGRLSFFLDKYPHGQWRVFQPRVRLEQACRSRSLNVADVGHILMPLRPYESEACLMQAPPFPFRSTDHSYRQVNTCVPPGFWNGLDDFRQRPALLYLAGRSGWGSPDAEVLRKGIKLR